MLHVLVTLKLDIFTICMLHAKSGLSGTVLIYIRGCMKNLISVIMILNNVVQIKTTVSHVK